MAQKEGRLVEAVEQPQPMTYECSGKPVKLEGGRLGITVITQNDVEDNVEDFERWSVGSERWDRHYRNIDVVSRRQTITTVTVILSRGEGILGIGPRKVEEAKLLSTTRVFDTQQDYRPHGLNQQQVTVDSIKVEKILNAKYARNDENRDFPNWNGQVAEVRAPQQKGDRWQFVLPNIPAPVKAE